MKRIQSAILVLTICITAFAFMACSSESKKCLSENDLGSCSRECSRGNNPEACAHYKKLAIKECPLAQKAEIRDKHYIACNAICTRGVTAACDILKSKGLH